MTAASTRVEELIAEAQRHQMAGRLTEAETLYLDALRLKPKHIDALYYLGVLRLQKNDPQSAIKLIDRAIKIRPDVVEMYLNLAVGHGKLGDWQRAVFAYRKAIALEPRHALAHFNLGNALRYTRDFDGAIAAYETFLREQPEDPPGHVGLACALAGAGRMDEAMTAFDAAITFDPDFAEAYEKAIELMPDVPDWRHDMAVAQLRLEKFTEGWLNYEARCDKEEGRVVRRAAPPPFWQGEDLAGKKLLVWMEQGLGDQIIFASILPEVINRAGACVVECTPRLAPIFARSFPTAQFVGNSNLAFPAVPTEAFDYQIGAGSLGRYTRPSIASFPPHNGFLAADPAKTAELRARYIEIAQGRRIVGISWRTRNPPQNESKSADLIGLAPILQAPGVLFVNLQYGDCRRELADVKESLGVEVLNDPNVNPLTDMDAFFAQVAAMDLVITTSNTTAHVAGALGKQAWVLLPPSVSLMWYWFLDRSESPWYPSVRLFRERTFRPSLPWWPKPVQAVAASLRDWPEQPLTS